MTTLAEMIARVAQPGRILWLGLRPARREGIVAVPEARIDAAGLLGDHGRAGKRAVTLLQAEHLPAIAAYLGRDDIPPEILRRNIVVAGLNLAGLKERPLRIGTALLRPTVICAPCSRMEAALGHGDMPRSGAMAAGAPRCWSRAAWPWVIGSGPRMSTRHDCLSPRSGVSHRP